MVVFSGVGGEGQEILFLGTQQFPVTFTCSFCLSGKRATWALSLQSCSLDRETGYSGMDRNLSQALWSARLHRPSRGKPCLQDLPGTLITGHSRIGSFC